MASRPSETMRGTMAKAAKGSALLYVPECIDSQSHQCDQRQVSTQPRLAASALNAALPVAPESRLFSFANHGITTAAATRMAIPRNVGSGSLYPSRLVTEVTATKAASANNKTPATRAARFSTSSCFITCTKSPQHYHRREKFDGAVSTEGKQSGTMRPPSYAERYHSVHTHPRDCDGLHPLDSAAKPFISLWHCSRMLRGRRSKTLAPSQFPRCCRSRLA
jgi:hypothetical protein